MSTPATLQSPYVDPGTAAMVFTQHPNASLSKTYKLRTDLVTMVLLRELY